MRHAGGVRTVTEQHFRTPGETSLKIQEHLIQFGGIESPARLETEVKSSAQTDAEDGRQREHHHPRFRNRSGDAAQFRHDGVQILPLARVAFRPVLESRPDRAHALVRSESADEIVARETQDPLDPRHVFHPTAQPFDQRDRPAPGSPFGQLSDEKSAALILVGQKRRGDLPPHEPSRAADQKEQQQRYGGTAGDPYRSPHIA